MNKKKSQISAVLIVVVFAVVLTFIYIYTKPLAKEKTSVDVDSTQELAPSIGPIKTFITSCLDRTVKDGIRIWGRQRGTIFTDIPSFTKQGGYQDPIPPSIPVLADIDDIKDPDFPEIDCGWYNDITNNQECYIPFGIINPDPSLYVGSVFNMYEIKNERIIPKFKGSDTYVDGIIVEPPLDIQLQYYIKNRIKGCLDGVDASDGLDAFSTKGNPVTVDISQVQYNDIEVIVSDEDISVRLPLPVTIGSTSKEDTSYENIFTSVRIRNKLIKEAMIDLIERDTSNPEFDIIIDGNPTMPPGIEIIKLPKDHDPDILHDTIRLNDTHEDSNIDGEQFLFQFTRQNRKPDFYNLPNPLIRTETRYFEVDTSTPLIMEYYSHDKDEDEIALFEVLPAGSHGCTGPTDSVRNEGGLDIISQTLRCTFHCSDKKRISEGTPQNFIFNIYDHHKDATSTISKSEDYTVTVSVSDRNSKCCTSPGCEIPNTKYCNGNEWRPYSSYPATYCSNCKADYGTNLVAYCNQCRDQDSVTCPPEDCTTVGDEDHNGLEDCADTSACPATTVCSADGLNECKASRLCEPI
tara:strand:+ start:4032 stop:5762 length:1731 start_codon:yes stop_codon:yes gene_type:complete